MKIGVVGLGWPGQQHVRAIKATGAVLAAVCDLDPAKRLEYEGVCAVYDNPEHMFEQADLDAVALAVPHHVHERLTVAALERGLHVLIEKPMARSSEECQRMIDAAELAGKTLMVAHNWRYTPWCIAAKAIVDSGELGNIQAVRTEWLLNFRPAFPKGSWIYNGDLAGGGAIVSLAIHNVDALRYIIGEVEEVFTHQLFTDDWSTNGAENWAMCQLRFASGAIGHLFTGYTPFDPPEHGMLYVYGDRGTMFYGPYQGKTGLWLRSAERSDDSEYQHVSPSLYAPGLSDHPQTNQLQHFLECVGEGIKPQTDGREIIQTIRLVEMMYASGSQGQPVKSYEGEDIL